MIWPGNIIYTQCPLAGLELYTYIAHIFLTSNSLAGSLGTPRRRFEQARGNNEREDKKRKKLID